jgi:hypothetical protein
VIYIFPAGPARRSSDYLSPQFCIGGRICTAGSRRMSYDSLPTRRSTCCTLETHGHVIHQSRFCRVTCKGWPLAEVICASLETDVPQRCKSCSAGIDARAAAPLSVRPRQYLQKPQQVDIRRVKSNKCKTSQTYNDEAVRWRFA